MVNICIVTGIDIDTGINTSTSTDTSKPTTPAAPASSPPHAVCVFGLGLFIQRAGNSTQLKTTGKHTYKEHKQRRAQSAERQHKERVSKHRRAFTSHPHKLFIHTHSLTFTTLVLCIAFALFHTVFHHTSCHPLRRLSTHTGGVFGLSKSLHTFGAVLLCCLLRGTVVIAYEV